MRGCFITPHGQHEEMFHVIDDEEALRELAVELLNYAGYQALSYSNPATYLDLVRDESYVPPAAIFTDIRMPEMDGYTLIDNVRKRFPEQRFVVISGFHENNRAFNKSPCLFLNKPYAPEKLIEIANAITQCEKQGPSMTSSTCNSLLSKDFLKSWSCPLECLECGKKSAEIMSIWAHPINISIKH